MCKFKKKLLIFLKLNNIFPIMFDFLSKSLSKNDILQIEHEILVLKIKKKSLFFFFGPIWFQKIFEKIILLWYKNKLIIPFVIKILLAIFFIILPLAFFILIRGILPVPERIYFDKNLQVLNEYSSSRIDWPYTLAPFDELQNLRVTKYATLPAKLLKKYNITEFKEDNNPKGLIQIGSGIEPIKVEYFKGFLVSEKFSINIYAHRKKQIQIMGKNKLKIKILNLKGDNNCRLEIKDSKNETIIIHEKFDKNQILLKDNFSKQIEERVIPFSLYKQIKTIEYTFYTDEVPDFLNLLVLYNNKIFNTQKADVSDANCLFIVGGLSFIYENIEGLKNRGTIVISVNGLNTKEGFNDKLMPNINQFFNNDEKYKNYYSNSNNLIFSSFSFEFGTQMNSLLKNKENNNEHLLNYHSLANIWQTNAYNTAMIGHISPSELSVWQNSILLETPHYESRMITEEAGNWLEKNGNIPFFLYLKYNTLRAPFRPPWQDLDFIKLLPVIFNLSAEQELYKGLARQFDYEFSLLIKTLEKLKLLNQINIILFSMRGQQITEYSYNKIINIDKMKGATRTYGPLLDEEIHVPLFIKMLNKDTKLSTDKIIWQKDLYLLLKDMLMLKNKKNDNEDLFFESYNYTGFITKKNDIYYKYILQKVNEKKVLFMNKFPWRTEIFLNNLELFAKKNDLSELFNDEQILAEEDKNMLRSKFFNTNQIIKNIEINFDSNIYINLDIFIKEKAEVKIIDHNTTIVINGNYKNNNYIYSINQIMKKNTKIILPWEVLKVESQQKLKIHYCNNKFSYINNNFINNIKNQICTFLEYPLYKPDIFIQSIVIN